MLLPTSKLLCPSAPEQFSPFRLPMRALQPLFCLIMKRRDVVGGCVMSHHRFKVAPVAVGAFASGFGLRLQKAKGWLSAIVCGSAELVHGGLHYSYCRETRIEWLLYCLNTIRARGVIST